MGDTLKQPLSLVDDETKLALKAAVETEAQVIVHCHFFATSSGDRFRIWKSTFLVDHVSKTKSKLLHAENVPFYPEWKIAERAGWHSFTLVFEALPKSCKHFDLLEQIPEEGAFHVRNIARNKMDVYNVEL